jgi:hypothetical protein
MRMYHWTRQGALTALTAALLIAASALIGGCAELGECCEICTYTQNCEDDVTREVCDEVIERNRRIDGCNGFFYPY